MALKNPGIPKGTRDFSSEEIKKRQYVTRIVEKHFLRSCFEPLETPSFENLNTLMGNYGEEGDRLIFKILNSGDYISKVDSDLWQDSKKLTPVICEKALRYDLTVPFSRYVAMNRDLKMPFKRYQIQPVWRADRPQKGRFREFYQCDADVVGSKSLWQEVELIQLYDNVLSELKLRGIININNRKILAGLAEIANIKGRDLTNFTVALDKLDKIGKSAVIEEMIAKGICEDAIEKIEPIFDFKGTNDDKFLLLEKLLVSSAIGREGIEELKFVVGKTTKLCDGICEIRLDLTLARGLHYYTGCIFEVSARDVSLGSIGGGGRYDNLTEAFGVKDISGVGISFGLDRICICLKTLDLFPSGVTKSLQVLFVNFGEREAMASQEIIKPLRDKGICAALYPEVSKLKKQMSYANAKRISHVVVIGYEELQTRTAIVKNMDDGTQVSHGWSDITNYFVRQNEK